MSKYKDELIDRLTTSVGQTATPEQVVSELYALGVLDDTLSRKWCAVHEYLIQSTDTSRSDTAILSEVAERFGVHEVTAWKWVRAIA